MSITTEQAMDKVRMIEKFQDIEYAAQVNRTLSPKDRKNQMRIAREQVLRGREELDRMCDRMTEEETDEADRAYEEHQKEVRQTAIDSKDPAAAGRRAAKANNE